MTAHTDRPKAKRWALAKLVFVVTLVVTVIAVVRRRAAAARAALVGDGRAVWPPLSDASAATGPMVAVAPTRTAAGDDRSEPSGATASVATASAVVAVAEPAPARVDEVAPWVEPEGKDAPPTHPVKVKTASGIYHLPGMLNYERTVPDRCYASAEAAEADGFRPAKR